MVDHLTPEIRAEKRLLPRKCRKIPRGVATYVNHVMTMIYASKRLPPKVAKDGVDFFFGS